jgi:hypothetical protein
MSRWQTEGRPLPLPDRWDPYRLGKIVIGVFLLLALIAGALLFARVVSDDEEPARRRGAANPPRETSPTPSGFILKDTIIGASYKQVEAVLKQKGFEVKVEKEQNDEYDKEEIFATQPAPGSRLFPGDTITLFVSEGPEEEDEDEHPGKGPPPGKGKEKDDD